MADPFNLYRFVEAQEALRIGLLAVAQHDGGKEFGRDNAAPKETRREGVDDGLDFGKFRHQGRSSETSSPVTTTAIFSTVTAGS